MKPRETLEKYGAKSLSDDELIAVILGAGTKKEDIFHCSRRILEQFNHEELVNIDNIRDFMKTFHLGYARSAQLIAAFEIGKRFFRRMNGTEHFRTPEQVYDHVRYMENLQKEHVVGLYLDARYKLIYEETLCIGGLNFNMINPREVFRPALLHNAYAFIMVHNHPSGDPMPSPEDQATTKLLMQASEIMQIPLLDHLVIGRNGYKSLQEAKT